MSSSRSFSILGKNIKANSAADLEPYLTELKNLDDVEEVHFGANSLGVEACQAIAEVLKTKKSLKVCIVVLGIRSELMIGRRLGRCIHWTTYFRNPPSSFRPL
jgi:Ran GTPase-activating protein (RanGAP) involved in mRNA processing and transport